MPTLGEILGGIVHDVVRARLLGDQMACESARAYSDDRLLAEFPVPRVVIRDATVKLRFAIDSIAEAEIRNEMQAEARELWKKEISLHLLPRLTSSTADADAVRAASDILLTAKTPEFGLSAAMKGNTSAMLRETVSFLTSGIAKLPPVTRRKLGTNVNIRSAATRELPALIDTFIERAARLADAKAAARTDLQVLIKKADLENAKEQVVHEFTFTLSLEDFQITGPGAGTLKESP